MGEARPTFHGAGHILSAASPVGRPGATCGQLMQSTTRSDTVHSCSDLWQTMKVHPSPIPTLIFCLTVNPTLGPGCGPSCTQRDRHQDLVHTGPDLDVGQHVSVAAIRRRMPTNQVVGRGRLRRSASAWSAVRTHRVCFSTSGRGNSLRSQFRTVSPSTPSSRARSFGVIASSEAVMTQSIFSDGTIVLLGCAHVSFVHSLGRDTVTVRS